MKEVKEIELNYTEEIIAVVPKDCRGPGWSDQIVWVYIIDNATSKYRSERIQPNERSDAMHYLWNAGEAMAVALRDAVPVKRVVK